MGITAMLLPFYSYGISLRFRQICIDAEVKEIWSKKVQLVTEPNNIS